MMEICQSLYYLSVIHVYFQLLVMGDLEDSPRAAYKEEDGHPQDGFNYAVVHEACRVQNSINPSF